MALDVACLLPVRVHVLLQPTATTAVLSTAVELLLYVIRELTGVRVLLYKQSTSVLVQAVFPTLCVTAVQPLILLDFPRGERV